jgi:ribosomal protein L40E
MEKKATKKIAKKITKQPLKSVKKPKALAGEKLCRKCNAKNKSESLKCIKCSHEKFHPVWVKEHRSINRSVSVDVTKSNPPSGEPVDRITLNKFFPGGKPQNFNITSPEQWDKIKSIIEDDLAPILGWKKKEELLKAVGKELETKAKKNKPNTEISSLVEQYPQFTANFLDEISTILKNADFEKVQTLLEHIANATSSYDEVFFSSLKQVFEQLKSQDKVSIVTFGELLKEWNLKQITDVTKEVKRRLNELNLFLDKIQDENTYEIRGENSIHRILERSMWLIDEKFWIIQSNKQLRTFIGNELAKEDKKYEKNRPDFACGNIDNTLIIIEIKRPSHTLEVEDLAQVVKYLRIAKKYLGNKKTNYRAMLIGNSKSSELEETMEFTQKIDLITYGELVQDCKKRYDSFLKHISNEDR